MVNTERGVAQRELEEQVRAACREADYERAATLLLQAIGPKVVAFLLQRLENSADASEVFSIFSEDLWRGLPAFEWRCTVRGWSFALARNAATRYRARAGAHRDGPLPLSQAPISGLAAQIRERTLIYLQTEVKTRMQELFQRLPEEDRALMQLRIDQHLSWRDLAVALDYDGKLPSDAELTRAAAKLRKRFQLIKERLRRLAGEAGLLRDET
jgi:RNA polymerase sigma-70 factor (ECF subfamily)